MKIHRRYSTALICESKEQIKEPTKQKQTHRRREQTDGCLKGKGLRGWGEKGDGIEKCILVVTKVMEM